MICERCRIHWAFLYCHQDSHRRLDGAWLEERKQTSSNVGRTVGWAAGVSGRGTGVQVVGELEGGNGILTTSGASGWTFAAESPAPQSCSGFSRPRSSAVHHQPCSMRCTLKSTSPRQGQQNDQLVLSRRGGSEGFTRGENPG